MRSWMSWPTRMSSSPRKKDDDLLGLCWAWYRLYLSIMVGPVPFYKLCGLDGTNYEAWSDLVKELLRAEGALRCIDVDEGRTLLNENGIPLNPNKMRSLLDQQGCKVILNAVDEKVAKDFTLNFSALQLWCAIRLRFRARKAAKAREILVEYVELITNDAGIIPSSDPQDEISNWYKIFSIAQRYPLSWLATDKGLDYLINSINHTITLWLKSKAKEHEGALMHYNKRQRGESEQTGSTFWS